MTGGGGQPGRIRFEPGLEGLRGLALLGMLCFHSRFWWASGGFLPLATFFTLSGYLITSLFLAEWESSGDLGLGRFWARRFRRLMPAALLTLACMPIFGLLVATPSQLQRLPDDMLWALFYMANWHFWLTDAAYQELFSAPSPALHFWSLSIEEQFYFAYPLIALTAVRLGGGSRRVLAAVLAGLTLIGVAVSILLIQSGSSVDRVYYGTDTRAPELLLGGLLAVVLHGRRFETQGSRRLLEGLGSVGLLVMLGLWAVVDISSLWVYQGGLAAYTLVSLAVIAGCVQPAGLARRVLATPVLRWIGRVSYGAYLFHWPIFVWLSPARTGLDDLPLLVARLGLTFSLAELSYRFVESPIRSGGVLRDWRAWVATPLAYAAVVGGALLTLPAPSSDRTYAYKDFDPETAITDLFAKLQEVSTDLPDPVGPTLLSEKPRVSVFGDSTGFMLSIGLLTWFWKEDAARLRPGVAQLGCGLLEQGTYRTAGRELGRANHCLDRDVWRLLVARGNPDMAVVLAGPWDVADRKLPGDEVWRKPGDPVLDAALRKEMLSIVDLLSKHGTLVLWLTHPYIQRRDWAGNLPARPFPVSEPARMDRLNALIRELETQRPGKVRVIDLAGYMRSLPGGELDETYRPDGVHLTRSASMRLADEWLGREVLRVYRDQAQRALAACEIEAADVTPGTEVTERGASGPGVGQGAAAQDRPRALVDRRSAPPSDGDLGRCVKRRS